MTEINGRPLKDAGLENLVIVHPDGRLESLRGLAVYEGQSLSDALNEVIPEGGHITFRSSFSPLSLIGEIWRYGPASPWWNLREYHRRRIDRALDEVQK